MIRTLLRMAIGFAATVAVFAAPGSGGAGEGGLLAAKTMTPKPGTVFRDCPECPELIVVPAGIFVMGSNKTRKTEKPAHRVNFKRPFAIGRYEVTFDQWLVCVAEKGCRHRPHDHNWGRKSRPVINITWDQAKNYLKWLSRKTGQTYRLPSEAEWEYVHRAGTRSKFWWGDETGSKMANCRDCESKQCCSAKDHSCCSHETKPVGTFGEPVRSFRYGGKRLRMGRGLLERRPPRRAFGRYGAEDRQLSLPGHPRRIVLLFQ